MSKVTEPARDLRVFQHIAANDKDRLIFVDHGKEGQLVGFRNSAYRRAVVWLRGRFGLDRTKDFDQPYDRFMSALQTSHYDFGPGKLERAQTMLDRSRQQGKPLTARNVRQVFQELDTAELSPNALADTNAVHTASREVGATIAKAEAALGAMASSPSPDAERAGIGSDLRAARRVLMLMHHKVADLEATLGANGQLHSAEAGLVRGMHDMLADQHQRIANLATEHGLDISESTASAHGPEAAAEPGSDTGANVYDRSSMVLDPTGISEAEVHGIMPHLLSDWIPWKEEMRTSDAQQGEAVGRAPDAQRGKAGSRTMSDVQRGDILHAKHAFFETHHKLQAQGRGLTENEIRQLDRYVEQAGINRFLGLHGGDPSRLPGGYRRQFDGMQSGLAKLPDEQGIVYRGTTTSHATIDRFRDSVGGLFAATAFLSTSAAPNFAKQFTRPGGTHNQAATDCEVRFQILGRSGKNISGIPELKEDLDAPDMDIIAHGPESPHMSVGNGEILFSPGTAFRLVAFAKHPQRDVYGMVLREEPRPEGRAGAVRNLQDANVMTNRGTVADVADGLANELTQIWDDRMESR